MYGHFQSTSRYIKFVYKPNKKKCYLYEEGEWYNLRLVVGDDTVWGWAEGKDYTYWWDTSFPLSDHGQGRIRNDVFRRLQSGQSN